MHAVITVIPGLTSYNPVTTPFAMGVKQSKHSLVEALATRQTSTDSPKLDMNTRIARK